MTIQNILFVGLLSASLSCGATEYVKETKITWVNSQSSRPVSPVTQNHDFINFATGSTWTVNGGSGGSTCPEIAAVLPADNAMMRAIALSAIAKGATVSVTVDNTLTMTGPYCQISSLSIKED